ncbi:MAG: S8 family serine peptidase [Desulfatiglandales bacterium]
MMPVFRSGNYGPWSFRLLLVAHLLLLGTLGPFEAAPSHAEEVTLSPSVVRVSAYEGHDPLNTWGLTLTNRTNGVLDLMLAAEEPWISCVPDKIRLDESDRIALVFSTADMPAGFFAGMIRILSGEGLPVAELPVSLNIIPRPWTSGSAALAGADRLHAHGIFGQGTSVAIVDIGFQHLDTVLKDARSPYHISPHDFTGRGLQADSYHGTAAAEVVHGLAPEATLYLLKIMDEETLDRAVDFCIAHQVDIIVHPVGWFRSGDQDRSGVAAIAERAVGYGILWVNSAGNHAFHHYQAEFSDDNRNGYHEFNVQEGVFDESNEFYLSAGEEVSVYLNWNGRPGGEEDYDLFLMHNDKVVASSTNRQDGPSTSSESILSYFAAASGPYDVKIMRRRGDQGQVLNLFVDYPDSGLTYFTPENSLLSPAETAGVVAVGAINPGDWKTGGPPAPYSSRGPTPDGRIKPDIMGPGAVPVTFGNFLGTSPAAAYAGGLAALLKTLHPSWRAADLETFLACSSLDLGETGKDPLYGSGRVSLTDLVLGGTELLFPHVADVGEWWTGVVLTNTTDQPADINIFAYDDDGRLLAFRSETLRARGLLAGTAEQVSGAAIRTGSLKITSTRPLAGIAMYGNGDDIGTACAVDQPDKGLYLPCESGGDDLKWTGLALLNPNEESTAVTLALIGDEGGTLAEREVMVPANGKLLGKLSDLFSSPVEGAAAVTAQSRLPVAGLVVTAEDAVSVSALSGPPSGMPLYGMPAPDGLSHQIDDIQYASIHSVSETGEGKIRITRQDIPSAPREEDGFSLAAWQQVDFSAGKTALLPGLAAGRSLVIPYLVGREDWDTVCAFYNPQTGPVVAGYRFYPATGLHPSKVGTVTIPGQGLYCFSMADISPGGFEDPIQGSLFLDATGPVYGAAFFALETGAGGWAAVPARVIGEP